MLGDRRCRSCGYLAAGPAAVRLRRVSTNNRKTLGEYREVGERTTKDALGFDDELLDSFVDSPHASAHAIN
jgi:hypothetical protein